MFVTRDNTNSDKNNEYYIFHKWQGSIATKKKSIGEEDQENWSPYQSNHTTYKKNKIFFIQFQFPPPHCTGSLGTCGLIGEGIIEGSIIKLIAAPEVTPNKAEPAAPASVTPRD